jgi:hypothetical protein
MRYRLALAVGVPVVLFAVGGVAACQRTDAVPRPAKTSAAGPAPSPPSPTPSPVSAAERESADRLAVEQAWQRFLDVSRAVESRGVPREQWPTVVGAVAVDPTYTRLLRAAAMFEKQGLVLYGKEVLRPYWTRSVAGGTTAVMGDCLDGSRAGSMYEKTGVKRTVGTPRSNTRITLLRGEDGQWRVKLIEYLVNQPC